MGNSSIDQREQTLLPLLLDDENLIRNIIYLENDEDIAKDCELLFCNLDILDSVILSVQLSIALRERLVENRGSIVEDYSVNVVWIELTFRHIFKGESVLNHWRLEDLEVLVCGFEYFKAFAFINFFVANILRALTPEWRTQGSLNSEEALSIVV